MRSFLARRTLGAQLNRRAPYIIFLIYLRPARTLLSPFELGQFIMQDPQHQIAEMTARLLAAKDTKESQAVAEELQRLIRDHISALRRSTEELRKKHGG
jgi:hypothetical protein